MASSSTSPVTAPPQSQGQSAADPSLASSPVEMSTVVPPASGLAAATRSSGLLDSTAIPSPNLAIGTEFESSSTAAVETSQANTAAASTERPRSAVPAAVTTGAASKNAEEGQGVPATIVNDKANGQGSEDLGRIEPSESSTNAPPITQVETESLGPTININLLLTTGARHPYKITNKYLQKRQVQAEDNDPFNISVYTLKELIWREWREEWEARPLSPTAIRLIHFGRLLDDKVPIKDCRFSQDGPNVVHLTVKPQDLIDEELTQKGKRVNADGEDVVGGGPCRCIIL